MKIANISAKSKSFEFSSFVAGTTSAVVRWTNSTRNGFEFTFVGGRFYCSLFLLENEWNDRNVFHFVRNFLGWQIGRQRDEGIWKIQRHFRIFLFVNFIYKLPHNSPQYNMCLHLHTTNRLEASDFWFCLSHNIVEVDCTNYLDAVEFLRHFPFDVVLAVSKSSYVCYVERGTTKWNIENSLSVGHNLARFKSSRVTWKIECETF